MATNGCKLNSRLGFETLSTEILLTKLNVYWTFAKRKLTNCLPLLQKPKPNAQMGFRLGYAVAVFFSAFSLNTAFVSADKKVTITKLHLY